MKIIPNIDSTNSWIPISKEQMPDNMKEEILKSVQMTISKKNKSPKKIHLLVRLVGAACIVLFLLFSYEQYHTIRKINHLESRIAEKTSNQSIQYKNKNQLLIINSFVSWSDIKTLGLSADDPKLMNQILPGYLKSNLFGDSKLKDKFSKYLREFQLASKIYLP